MTDEPSKTRGGGRKIAVPVENGVVSEHFGHCEAFVVFVTDAEARSIATADSVSAPPHQPGFLPGWLRDLGVDVVIAGGMGRRAQDSLRSAGIEVILGASGAAARDVAQSYLDATLESGPNPCDH